MQILAWDGLDLTNETRSDNTFQVQRMIMKLEGGTETREVFGSRFNNMPRLNFTHIELDKFEHQLFSIRMHEKCICL